METIRSLIRIGHIFPAHRMFRTGLRKWVAKHKVSHLRGARAIAVRLILEECLGTEAGENLLGLVCILKIVLQVGDSYTKSRSRRRPSDERLTIWIRLLFCSLFKALGIPPTETPSEPQLHSFTSHCILGLKGVPELRLNKRDHYHDTALSTDVADSAQRWVRSFSLSEISLDDLPMTHGNPCHLDFLARMLLQLGDIAHSGDNKVLICSGQPWAFCAQAVAQVLGIGVHVRSRSGESDFGASAISNNSPNVLVFNNIGVAISEVMNRTEMPSGMGYVTYNHAIDETIDLWGTSSSKMRWRGRRLRMHLRLIYVVLEQKLA